MSYYVKASGLFLGYGRLHQCSSQATNYPHPSSAEVAAQKYMNRTGLEAMEVISSKNISYTLKRLKTQSGFLLRVLSQPDGSYRASGAGIVTHSRSKSIACHKLIDQWLEKEKQK